MSTSVISVKNLGKKYIISHQTGHGKDSLREAISDGVKALTRRNVNASEKITSNENFWALKDINFEIKQGDRVGIIGRNGAGKSTLLKIISRITEPTEGKITMKGRIASLLEVGTGFHAELTGRENIYLNGAILGMSKQEIKRKFDEIVAFSEVEKFLDTPVKRYSSGMYVRLAFAVAAHLEPEILIVDEVLAVGDAQFQKKCLGKIGEVGNDGKTVIFVSHNLIALKAICDKGIVLKQGGLIFDGEIDKAIICYSASSENSSELKNWLVTPSIEIYDVFLCDKDGSKLDYISTDCDIFVTITYNIKHTGQIGFTLNLCKNDEILFQSINNSDKCFYDNKIQGLYKTICILPYGFLNNGYYSIGLTVFELNYTNPKSFENIISFEVNDGSSNRGDYNGGLRGFIRPKLLWETIMEKQ